MRFPMLTPMWRLGNRTVIVCKPIILMECPTTRMKHARRYRPSFLVLKVQNLVRPFLVSARFVGGRLTVSLGEASNRSRSSSMVVVVGELPCCSSRGDVQTAFSQFPADNTANSGWGTGVNWGDLVPGSHAVQVKVKSTSGEILASDTRTVTVVKPGTSSFVDVFSLAGASAQIDGQDLLLKRVTIRDKSTQQQSDVNLTFRWFTNLQSFGMTNALMVSSAAVSQPSLLARAASGVRSWWQERMFGPEPGIRCFEDHYVTRKSR